MNGYEVKDRVDGGVRKRGRDREKYIHSTYISYLKRTSMYSSESSQR